MSRCAGFKTSELTKEKIRLSLMGRKHSADRTEKMRLSKTGRKWTAEERKNHTGCHSGENHWHWRGGRRRDISNGYVYLYDPAEPRGVLEHRVVAEKCLGRKLSHKETIHHINMIEDDNRPENLYLFESKQHHLWYHRKFNKDPKSVAFLESNIV